jgi:head-tail adaptor
MAGVGAGALRSRLTVLRRTVADDGFTSEVTGWTTVGVIAARKTDVSDGERLRAEQLGGEAGTRFLLRWSSPVARGITVMDRLTCDGVTWRITGVKDADYRQWIEVSAVRSLDA